ncbi:MAG: hypothetical protein JWM33_2023 [Caulobacteraceae bacterium]|nr:hypothetical protein [Caulobacteraceae bacterium]
MSQTIEIRDRTDDRLLFAWDLPAGSGATPSQALGLAVQAAKAAGISLAGAALRGVEAAGADLAGVRLRGAELSGGVLDGADLTGADLTGALMLRISAIGARFDRACLEELHAWIGDFSQASFNSAEAVSANFDEACLEGADLRSADFNDASLLSARLAGAQAQGMRLIGADATGADLTDTDLSGATLDHADLRGARLERTKLDGASLIGTRLGEAPPKPFDEDLDLSPEAKAERETLEVGWRRAWLVRAVPGAVAIAALSGWMAQQLILGTLGSDLSPSGRFILGAMFLAFTLLLGGAALTYGLSLFDKAAVVRLGPAGLEDRRLSAAPIPWSELIAVTPMLHGGQSMLALSLAKPKAYPLPRNPLWAVNRLSARLLGRPELSLRMTGLDAELPTLVSWIKAYLAVSAAATP